MTLQLKERIFKSVLFVVCSVPLAELLLQLFNVGSFTLGANPVEDIQDTTGIWGIRMLAATLAVTPLSWVIGPLIIRGRRMLGLFAFTYCALHFLNYLVLDQTLSVTAITEDIIERPFITVGFAALLAMLPLAITSTNNWRRKLGRSWTKLHRLTYLVGIFGCWHFYWQVKKDLTEPLIYCGIVGLLLGARVVRRYRRKSQAPRRTAETTDSNSVREC